MTPFASVAILEKLALLKIAFCRGAALSSASSACFASPDKTGQQAEQAALSSASFACFASPDKTGQQAEQAALSSASFACFACLREVMPPAPSETPIRILVASFPSAMVSPPVYLHCPFNFRTTCSSLLTIHIDRHSPDRCIMPLIGYTARIEPQLHGIGYQTVFPLNK